MMLREMEYIYAIYQERSFSQAAKKLHVSQPSLSSMVKKVEQSLDAELFDRSTNPISPTQAGEYYIRCAEKVLRIKNEMDDYFKNLSHCNRTVINVGAASFFCIYVLPGFINQFHDLHTESQINLVELSAMDMASLLLKGSLDFTVDVRKPVPNDIESIKLFTECVLLAVPARFAVNLELKDYALGFEDIKNNVHLDPSLPSVDIKKFKDEPFIMLRKGHDMTKRVRALCADAGFSPRVMAEFDQMLSSYRLMLKGTGVTFVRDGLPRNVEPTDGVVFYKINEKFLCRDVVLNYHKDRKYSPLVLQCIDFLSDKERNWQ
jgi:DNA-binding transcriptional LysR family regulator